MLYIKMDLNTGRPVSATANPPKDYFGPAYQTRNDWKDWQTVYTLAALLTEATGKTYLATDSGPHCSPRFDVIEAPKIGDEVSRYFNGDGYPAGKIVKMAKSYRRIETSDGSVFWRQSATGTWLCNGTWGMIAGVHNDRNPSF
jgi:hypothetical protein